LHFGFATALWYHSGMLKVTVTMLISICLFAARVGFAQTTAPGEHIKPVYQGQELHQLMRQVMDFQIKAYGPTYTNMWINWQAAPFWVGVMASGRATDDPAFLEATRKWGNATQWKIGRRYFHADDTAVGQAYTELYMRDNEPVMIADLKSKLDQYFDKKTVTNAEVQHGPAEAEWRGRNVWWWCDALFMAPPVLARMSAITGDKKYLEMVHSLWWDTTDYLFDPTEGLYFRDDSYFFDKKQSPTGKKVFWGRGNGWVYGGLIRTLDYIPKDDPQRQKYLDLYQNMTAAIVKYQQPDGLWRASVNEPTWIPQPESSCTGFYTYGVLAGINRGYLDRAKYLPIALKGWEGLCSVVMPNGGVGYAQQVGASPEAFQATSTKDYAQGAFLLAASELYQLKLTPQELKR
jgi:rhamnogalacturonyl hydrolase YesR